MSKPIATRSTNRKSAMMDRVGSLVAPMANSSMMGYHPDSPDWIRIEQQLERTIMALKIDGSRNLGLEDRMDLFKYRAVSHCMDFAHTERRHADNTIEAAWYIIANAMATVDNRDPREFVSVRQGVQDGIIELAAWELSFSPLRAGGRFADLAFTGIQSCAAKEEFVTRLSTAGIFPLCISILARGEIDTHVNRSVLGSALTTFSAISRVRSSILRGHTSVVKALVPLLSLLDRPENDLIVLGLCAARILIRLFDKDEVSQLVRDHEVLFDAYANVISAALASGPRHHFMAYDSRWSLSGLVFDLSIIAASGDANNTSHLAKFIPTVIKMVVLYGKNDAELVHYGLAFLSHLVYDDFCRQVIVNEKTKVENIAMLCRSNQSVQADTMAFLGLVMNELRSELGIIGGSGDEEDVVAD